MIIRGAAWTIYWPLKGLCQHDPAWNIEISRLVSNPWKDEGSLMLSAGVHRPKNHPPESLFSHVFQACGQAWKWGKRRRIFINVWRPAPCALLCCTRTVFSNTLSLLLEMICLLCCLQFKGANVVLTILCLAACSTKKKYFFGHFQVYLPSFLQPSSWIHRLDTMLAKYVPVICLAVWNRSFMVSWDLGGWRGRTGK